MTAFFSRIVPKRIAGQIALLVITSIVLAHAVAFATILRLWPRPAPPEIPWAKLAQLAYTARLLDAAPGGEIRARIVEAAHRSFPSLSYSAAAFGGPPEAAGEATPILQALQDAVGDRFTVSTGLLHFDLDGRERVIAHIRLPDGSSVSASLPNSLGPPERRTRPSDGAPAVRLAPGPRGGVLVGTLVLASTLALLSLWAARRLAAPLTRFAEAANQFTVDGLHHELREEGPFEIERAARALNEMRARIKSLVDDRTRMLAAVGHDLRTPITRLLLRAEDIVDPALRRRFIADLRNLSGMIESALSFLREQTVRSEVVRTDLSSLLQSVCDNFADVGARVDFVGPLRYLVDCDPDQIARAMTNLIENAVKFGRSAIVRLKSATAHTIEIEVEDNGPGIPDAEKEKVFEPFYRADAARRSNERGGFGLGLSIARAIAKAHGGSLTLADATPSGLVARFSFPTKRVAPMEAHVSLTAPAHAVTP
jgi:signal transduction histidine kinase